MKCVLALSLQSIDSTKVAFLFLNWKLDFIYNWSLVLVELGCILILKRGEKSSVITLEILNFGGASLT